jgi:DUF1680 family protein
VIGAADEALFEMGYGQVQLTRGPLERQARQNHRLLLGLDEDALLRPYRVRAGLAAPGPGLGGWYDAQAFAPGATFGQWLSALSRFFSATGDRPTSDKVHRLVRAYAATVESDGRFYQNNRFPAYIYDKLVGGLIEARLRTQDTAALNALRDTTQAALPYLPGRAIPRNEHSLPGEDFSRHAWDESYTLPENQFFAWHLTGDDRHRNLAMRFLYDDFFAALAAGDNVLPGKHAYSHVNALSSAAQAFLSVGSAMHLAAAREGFAMIDAQSYATGGWGPDEHFVAPDRGALGASLDEVKSSFETPCGAYAHLKLTRYLLRITRDSRYGDSMERVLYNTVLGALPIQSDGRAFYYSDYTYSAKKTVHPDRWPCCSGTLPMIAADYAISVCFTDALGIYLNLYVPAQVTWHQGDAACRLAITTDYPHDGLIRLELQLPTTLSFTMNLRIPAWTADAQVCINGRREPGDWLPGTFAAIHREWRPGDRIDLELPLPLRLLAADAQHGDTVALLAGPLVLMRVLDSQSTRDARLTRDSLQAARRLPGGSHDWEIRLPGREPAIFRPFMDIGDELYSVYQDVAPVTPPRRGVDA